MTIDFGIWNLGLTGWFKSFEIMLMPVLLVHSVVSGALIILIGLAARWLELHYGENKYWQHILNPELTMLKFQMLFPLQVHTYLPYYCHSLFTSLYFSPVLKNCVSHTFWIKENGRIIILFTWYFFFVGESHWPPDASFLIKYRLFWWVYHQWWSLCQHHTELKSKNYLCFIS